MRLWHSEIAFLTRYQTIEFNTHLDQVALRDIRFAAE
ncbi:hypothetical protein UC8_01880 [Roseimaritima ulvae]|uniref:Uncharacterized protein n=1 Tax=Roseimaritima ulvae TaxID=980254 RepID=A0A5B9QWB3_9BACT|nr:hypothetical protein UC8_01880 [Roseimaritima ulvae]